jgi:hypothetical protein
MWNTIRRSSRRSWRSSIGSRWMGGPHPTTLMKLTTRCGSVAVDGLNEALLVANSVGGLLWKPTEPPTPDAGDGPTGEPAPAA